MGTSKPCSFNFPAILQPSGSKLRKTFCQSYGQVFVRSIPHELQVRKAIRLTWAKVAARHNIRVYFFMGTPLTNKTILMNSLKRESAIHQDIFVFDFPDTYKSGTVRTSAMLQWYVRKTKVYCASKSFRQIVMIVDRDAIVYPQNIRKFADRRRILRRRDNVIAGLLWSGAPARANG